MDVDSFLSVIHRNCRRKTHALTNLDKALSMRYASLWKRFCKNRQPRGESAPARPRPGKGDTADGPPESMRKIVTWLRGQAMLVAAAILAAASMLLIPPDAGYGQYIDWRVLSLLFCLMLVVAGLRKAGAFDWMGRRLLLRVHTQRQLAAVLIFLPFFTSMAITNDVALITFVPFALSVMTMAGRSERLIPLVALQTLAANLGSMLTPIGNPQNLYLYSLADMGMGEFLGAMLPLTAASGVLLAVCLLLFPAEPLSFAQPQGTGRCVRSRLWIYGALFLACMGTVARLYDYGWALLITAGVVLCLDWRLFAQVDYALLATFLCFFVLIGNLGRLPAVREALESLLAGRERAAGILLSQVMSNVPAAMLLSGFTTGYRTLLEGVNLGGLGTLIASMASLISYQAYVRSDGARPRSYLGWFTALNVAFLAALWGLAALW